MVIGRIDQPIEYRELWYALRTRLGELATDQAIRCVTQKDLSMVPRHQGAYEFCKVILVEMERLVDSAKTARYASEDQA